MRERQPCIDDQVVADRERAAEPRGLSLVDRERLQLDDVKLDRAIEIAELHAESPRADRRTAVERVLRLPRWRHVAIDVDRFGSVERRVGVCDPDDRDHHDADRAPHPMIREPSS